MECFLGGGPAECSGFHQMTCADDARPLVASEAARVGVWRKGQDGRHGQCTKGLAVALLEVGRLGKRLLYYLTGVQDGRL